MIKLPLTALFAFAILYNIAISQTLNDQQLTVEIDKLFSSQFIVNEPGAEILIARKGKIFYKKALGMANLELNIPMKPDMVFRIGSLTKQFTAVAILQLMEQGKLSLQDEITRFIPDYPMQGQHITIEHLLTHTSGIKAYTSMKEMNEIRKKDMTPNEVIDFFKNQPMDFVPGTKWKYNNSGYFLLGYIIEAITGKTYSAYLEDTFIKPLGLSDTYYGSDTRIIKNRVGAYDKDKDAFVNAEMMSMTIPYAAGAIQSTVYDYFKWYQALLGYRLVKKETLDQAFKSYVLSNGKPANYGYGWFQGSVQGSATVEHTGSINGFRTMELYLPAEDVFVVLFSNCYCHPRPVELVSKIAALCIGKPYDFTILPISNDALKNYAGAYTTETGQQQLITDENNQLFLHPNGQGKLKINPYQKDKFNIEGFLSTLEFIRDESNNISRILFNARVLPGKQDDGIWNKNILIRDSIKSSIDSTTQIIYYYKSTAKKRMPLVVQLHSWSYPADSLKTSGLDTETISKNYNYLFPNFRGVNNQIKACCSNFVISDIDEAIDWAIKNMNVDRKQIYIVGYSGGGYATLAMYMKSRHEIKAFSAWVPIADIGSWYRESVERKNKYSAEIIKCTTETGSFDTLKARDRSPQFWKTPVKKRSKSTIQIFAGIHDGYTGPVPISQSVGFYNKLLSDNGISDSSQYVSQKDLDYMLNQQTFNASNNLKIGDRIIYYQRKSGRIMLTIFEGGHEMLSNEVFESLNK